MNIASHPKCTQNAKCISDKQESDMKSEKESYLVIFSGEAPIIVSFKWCRSSKHEIMNKETMSANNRINTSITFHHR